MTIPEWLKLGLYGAVIGAVFVGIVGFSWGGWMTGGGASRIANATAHDQVIGALLPTCLDIFNADADRVAKRTTIREASTFRRRDAVMQAGWATVPGSEEPNRNLAQACATALDLEDAS